MVKHRISKTFKTIAFLFLLLAGNVRAQNWEAIAPMLQVRYDAKCVELKNGLILVAGGQDNSQALTECELYDPVKNQWAKLTGDSLKSKEIPTFHDST